MGSLGDSVLLAFGGSALRAPKALLQSFGPLLHSSSRSFLSGQPKIEIQGQSIKTNFSHTEYVAPSS